MAAQDVQVAQDVQAAQDAQAAQDVQAAQVHKGSGTKLPRCKGVPRAVHQYSPGAAQLLYNTGLGEARGVQV